MDSDRKYRQNGYLDTTNSSSRNNGHDGQNGARPKPAGPRPPIDVTGPRLPRLVQTVTASRCYNCSTALPGDMAFDAPCPKCGVQLHCCKQCSYFEPSTRFQCVKPVPVRIALKDQRNECALFKPRMTVAREATSTQPSNANRPPTTLATPPPRNASDARDAFDRLFKK